MALLYLFSGKYQILSLGRSLSVNMFVQSRAMHLALVSCCAESAVWAQLYIRAYRTQFGLKREPNFGARLNCVALVLNVHVGLKMWMKTCSDFAICALCVLIAAARRWRAT